VLRNLDPAGRGRTTGVSAPKGMSPMSHQRGCPRESRPLPSSPSPQRHTKSRCFYPRRGITPVKFRRDHGCLCLLARERLQHAHLFFRPCTQLSRRLRCPCPLLGHLYFPYQCRQRISGHHPSRIVAFVPHPSQKISSTMASLFSFATVRCSMS